MKTAIAAEGLKATPPVTVTAALFAGLTVSDVLTYTTLVYVVIQAAYLIWKWVREYRAGS